ncbi:MAG: hypothetical protein K0R54_737 [Clostridiaceae bacterium]|jgi:hypothetical protein|nr:hypothetical protein [Clostridiaceae bacterium]
MKRIKVIKRGIRLNKEKLEECIKGMFDSIIKEDNEKFGRLIMDSLESLKNSGYNFSNPESFNSMIISKFNRGLNSLANGIHDLPSLEIKDTNKPNFIYLNYNFLEQNIRNLCVLREGNSCCADKSRAILKMYLKYSLTGEINEYKPEIECYWLPKFGTNEEWVNYCDGLYLLYYGKTEKYLASYNILIKSEKRTYKHILHNWYMKFVDGNIIRITNTWDDRFENPLDNIYYDKGDYYILSKNLLNDRNYEHYEGNEPLIDNYCKVPKSDIIEIYKVSEEVMV